MPTTADHRDVHDVLGVRRNADAAAIRRAFHDRARHAHPNVATDPEAEVEPPLKTRDDPVVLGLAFDVARLLRAAGRVRIASRTLEKGVTQCVNSRSSRRRPWSSPALHSFLH